MSDRDVRDPIDREHPIGGEMSDIVRGLVRRVQLDYLVNRYSSIPVLAIFSFVNGCLSIALMALTALVTRAPFVFPSLGPTAFLFFYTPTAPTASPRNALVGHAVGAGAGYLSLVLFGLTDAGPAVTSGMTWQRVLAAALSLGLTSGVMVLLRSPHPPAGATTLIISLGVLREPWQIGVLMLAVVMLTLQAFVINRAAGIEYPLWNPVRRPAPGGAATGRR
jgi:CBS-domain-containing membrane protein